VLYVVEPKINAFEFGMKGAIILLLSETGLILGSDIFPPSQNTAV